MQGDACEYDASSFDVNVADKLRHQAVRELCELRETSCCQQAASCLRGARTHPLAAVHQTGDDEHRTCGTPQTARLCPCPGHCS